MKRLALLGLLAVVLITSGCGKKEQEVDTPAGHPDELRDSTRLDPAVDSSDTSHEDSGHTDQPKRKYRFSS